MLLIKKIFLSVFIILSISACTSTKQASSWPENLPPRSIFIDSHEKQVAAGTNDSSLKTHLTWIKRFYRGLSIYPGWNDMTEMFIDSLSEEPVAKQESAKQRLDKLGLKIAIEWAQSNDKRNINSANINTWGNALRTSVKRKQQLAFLNLVEQDVDDLLNKKLNSKAIKAERYYPPEDLDDF